MEKIKEIRRKIEEIRKDIIDVADDVANECYPLNEDAGPKESNKVYGLITLIKAAEQLKWIEANFNAVEDYLELPF